MRWRHRRSTRKRSLKLRVERLESRLLLTALETGDFVAEVSRLKDLAFASGSNQYVAPTGQEQIDFNTLAANLLGGNVVAADSQAPVIGYEVVEFTDTVSGDVYHGLREQLVGIGAPVAAGDEGGEDDQFASTAEIHGQKWNDLDGDGVRDAGEPGLNGWEIQLFDHQGDLVDSRITMDMDLDSNGSIDPETERGLYWFTALADGTYTVGEVQQIGWSQTSEGGVVPADPDGFNVDKLSQLTVSAFPGGNTKANDITGYVSPSGREYAIIGLSHGTGYVEVTDPANPVIVGFISGADEASALPGGSHLQDTNPMAENSCSTGECEGASIWRDIKTFDQYAYVTNETGGGLQIVDLTQIDSGTVAEVGTLTASGLQTAHNVAINPDSGFAYLTGTNIASGGLVAVDVGSNPAAPTIVGIWADRYIHDVEIVSYTSGPAAGQEIAYGFAGGDGVNVIDVTNKAAMTTLARVPYPNVTYAHYGELSKDLQHLFVNDELDELNNANVTTTTTYVLDVSTPASPVYLTSFTNGSPAIDHNLETRGDFLFEANYRSGLRVFDVRDVNNVQETGYYDTYPANDAAAFNGAWGVYADLPSGVVLISDLESGLFVLDATKATGGFNRTYKVTLGTGEIVSSIDFGNHQLATVTGEIINGGSANRSGVAEISFVFDEAVTVDSAAALRVYNHTTGTSIDLSAATLQGNGTSVVTWNVSPVNSSEGLPDGRYSAELPAANATGAGGLPLAKTHTSEFLVLLGDVSGDGAVNFADYGVVGSNFDPLAGTSFRAGDVDGNGLVNFADYGVIGANFDPLGLAALSYDLGDAPQASTNYPTTLDNNGAVHVLGSGLFLGTGVDGEADGQPEANAAGDDNAGDDEDGVTFGSLTAGSNASVTVVASVPSSAVLNAWVDFNADGDWSDVGEQIFTNKPLANGSQVLSFNVPAAAAGDTFARFRVTTSADYSFSGLAPDGEVEDYEIDIGAPAAASALGAVQFPVVANTSHTEVEYSAYQVEPVHLGQQSEEVLSQQVELFEYPRSRSAASLLAEVPSPTRPRPPESAVADPELIDAALEDNLFLDELTID